MIKISDAKLNKIILIQIGDKKTNCRITRIFKDEKRISVVLLESINPHFLAGDELTYLTLDYFHWPPFCCTIENSEINA